jgi:hypothetical protein
MADILQLHTQPSRLARTRQDMLTHREVAHPLEQGLIHALVNGLAGKATCDGAVTRNGTLIMLAVGFCASLTRSSTLTSLFPALASTLAMPTSINDPAQCRSRSCMILPPSVPKDIGASL